MSNPDRPAPYAKGDWVTTAYQNSVCYAPKGQRVWQASEDPVLFTWGWATNKVDAVSAFHFRRATSEEMAAEIARIDGEIDVLNGRRAALSEALLTAKKP